MRYLALVLVAGCAVVEVPAREAQTQQPAAAQDPSPAPAAEPPQPAPAPSSPPQQQPSCREQHQARLDELRAQFKEAREKTKAYQRTACSPTTGVCDGGASINAFTSHEEQRLNADIVQEMARRNACR